MSGSENKWLSGICGGMDLCWLFAGSLFLVSATAGTVTFPFIRCGLLFVLAALLTGYQHRTSPRRIWKVTAHLLLLAAMVTLILHSAGLTFYSRSIYGVYQAALVSLLMVGFWYKGMMFAVRKLSYETVCQHFDLGTASFLVLMIMNLLIHIKGGQAVAGQAILVFATVFLIGSMAAVFLARNSGSGQKKYQKGFEIHGILISTGMVLLLAGAGVWIFFQPGMNQVTRDGYDWFVQASAPMKPYIIGILKILLRVSGNSPAPSSPAGQSGGMKWGDLSIPDKTAHWIDSVAGFGFAALALLMLVAIVVILAVTLYRWLMVSGSGQRHGQTEYYFFKSVFQWLCRVRAISLCCMARKGGGLRYEYQKLTRWGHNSGVSMKVNETPMEYGHRLSDHFEPLSREIHTIVYFFCLEVYGRQKVSKDTVHSVKTAVRLIRHPRFWPMRVKSFFSQRFLTYD